MGFFRVAEQRWSDTTPGMRRRLAIHRDEMWSGTVDTEPHATSGWHHHGDFETTLYVVSGRMRMESGRGGAHVVEAGPGDFLRVPAGAVHRESNPSDEPASQLLKRLATERNQVKTPSSRLRRKNAMA